MSEPGFGEVLQQALDDSHLENASQLATAAGIGRLNIYRWLRGESSHPQQRMHVVALAGALGLRRAETNYLLHLSGFLPIERWRSDSSSTPQYERDLAKRWCDGPTNLPSDLTSFIGRSGDLYRLAHLLCQPSVRLVTLTGAGGSGKTRLGQRIAGELLDAFPDGVWYVPLSTARTVQDVLGLIRRALNLREATAESDLDRIAHYLETRSTLLVLDNVEQVSRLGITLVDLLQRTERLKLLVTSRAKLHVSGEHEHEVEPFELPSDEVSWQSGRDSDAIHLFLERARARDQSFSVTARNYLPVLSICRRLSGMPLAIELAAARTRSISPERMLDAFPSPLDLAADGPVDVEGRHRDLRATIDWSLDFISEEASSVFNAAGIFAGGWTIEAMAEVVAAVDPALDVRAALDELVDGSLIQYDATTGRYAIHEIIREHAAERLRRSGLEDATRFAHARFCLGLVKGEQHFIPLTRREAWMEALDSERANCLVALSRAVEHGEAVVAAGLCSMLWPYWHEYSQMSEGRYWIEQVLETVGTGSGVPEHLVTWLRTGLLVMDVSQGEYAEAAQLCAGLRPRWDQIGSSYGLALVCHYESWTAFATGDVGHAVEQAQLATSHWQDAGLLNGVAASLNHQAFVLMFCGQFEAALKILDEARALHRQLDDRMGTLRTDHDIGTALIFKGDVGAGIRMLERVVYRRDEAAQSYIISATLFYLGYGYCLAGQLDRALECERESLQARLDLGDRLGISYNLLAFAAIASRMERWRAAARLCGAAAALHQDTGIAFNPVSHEIYERESAVVRRALGEERYQQELVIGASLPQRDIVAEAMSLAIPKE